MMKRIIVSVVLALAGCASSQEPVRTYMLNEPEEVSSNQLCRVNASLSPYLAGLGLVYRVSENEVITARNNIWAEDIQYQVNRYFKSAEGERCNVSASIYFERFNGTYEGEAELAGKWELNGNQEGSLASGKFYITESLQADGYEALVDSYQRGLNTLLIQLNQNVPHLSSNDKI